MTYTFRFEEDDELVEVDFETMMTQDSAGYITVDGRRAKRVYGDSIQDKTPKYQSQKDWCVVSDSLGVSELDVMAFDEDARRHGFSSVEFVKDPDFEETRFYQAKCTSPKQWEEYVAHRIEGGINRSGSRIGVAVTEAELNTAAWLVKRTYG